MIDIKKLYDSMPPSLQRKVSCEDLKRTVDSYNQSDKLADDILVRVMDQRDEAKRIAEELRDWQAESLKRHGQGFEPNPLPWEETVIMTSGGKSEYRSIASNHHESGAAKTGVELIAAERERQIIKEGWSAAHDDMYHSGELVDAAVAYAQAAAEQARGESIEYLKGLIVGMRGIRWPWEDEYWRPSEDPLRNLIKAGALIAAEIDRLSRQNDKILPR